MKAISIILVAVGVVAMQASALSVNLKAAKPAHANSIITRERHDKIKNRTA
jgi:hypothetical protein